MKTIMIMMFAAGAAMVNIPLAGEVSVTGVTAAARSIGLEESSVPEFTAVLNDIIEATK